MIRALIGYGGLARELIAYMGSDLPAFVDDEYYNPSQKNTLPLSKFDPYTYEVVIALGDSVARHNIVSRMPKETKYFTYVHESAIITTNVELGEGSIVCPGAIITVDTKLGKHTLLNISSTVAHDCTIGNYFTASPGANISGTCMFGDRIYFGTNSSCRQKIRICDDVFIGMQSGVVHNILEPGTYVGSPAKKIR